MEGLDNRSLQATWETLPESSLRDLGSCWPRTAPCLAAPAASRTR